MKKEIIVFERMGDFSLYSDIASVKKLLSDVGSTYTEEVWSNAECTHPVPWTILRIDAGLVLFFAKDRLFKICVFDNNDYVLPSGIYTGLSMDEAQRKDPALTYNDWDEDWQSTEGYWIEDDLETNTVSSISIFIKEVLDDDIFDTYEWCNASLT